MTQSIDYRRLFEQSSTAAILVALDPPRWTIVAATDAYLAVTHTTREALVGVGTFEAFPESDGTAAQEGERKIRESFERALAEERRIVLPEQRYDLPRPNGGFDEQWWELSSTPLRDAAGRITVIVHEVANVTARRAAQDEARRLQEELAERNEQLQDQAAELELTNQQLQENAVELEAQAEELQATAAQLEERTEEAELARRTAETAEARIAELFRQAPAFIAVVRDADHVFELVNDAYYQLVGYRDIIGKTVLDALPEVRGQGFIELLDEVRRTGKAFVGSEMPLLVMRTPGAPLEQRFVNFVYGALKGAGGTRDRVFAHGVDVTEQVQAREALAAREGELRTLADAIPTLAWTARADGYIEWYNARWYEYTGTTPADMEGWGWQAVHHPDVLPFVLELWRESIANAKPFEMTFPLRGADGHYRAFLTRVSPLRDESGRVIRWFGVNTDVDVERTALERAERAVVRTEALQRLTAALAAARTVDDVARVVVAEGTAATGAKTGMLALLDGDGEAVMVRQAGLDADTGSRFGRFPLTMPGPAGECLRTGHPIFVETRDGPDGLAARFPEIATVWENMDVHAVATVPLVVDDAITGAMSFAFGTPRPLSPEDRTFFLTLGRQGGQAMERARLFDAERAARAAAEEARHAAEVANEAKTSFLATMSHELRTPLNALGGFIELLQLELRGPLTDLQRGDLARMQRSQQHLLRLINDVLNFAKLDTGHASYDITDVAVGHVMQQIGDLMAPQFAAKGVGHHIVVSDPDVLVRADAERLGQILLNLLSNAAKYTPRDGFVTVWYAREGPVVRIHVRDTGQGIAPEQLEAIFDPFVQVGRRLNQPVEGIGLGLAISRDLAEGMGGSLTAASTVGEGSTFTLTLPAAGVDRE
jgi:PAS domain S-box-containing protein